MRLFIINVTSRSDHHAIDKTLCLCCGNHPRYRRRNIGVISNHHSHGIFFVCTNMNVKYRLLLVTIWAQLLLPLVYSATPVVFYHGMGDTAHGSIKAIQEYLEQEIPGIYVNSIRMGNNTEEDFLSSYFMNLNEQVSSACQIIQQDPKLKNGYNAIGFSQGGQIVRAIAQRCPDPPIRNLISIGGQHQGVYGLPRCFGDSNTLCDIIRKMLNHGAYLEYVQENLVQAEYWHDPIQEDDYREKSVFLADINNERLPRNETYKTNLVKLNNLVLVKFLNETIVEPKESEWFEFYAPGQTDKMVSLKDSPIYKEDWIGLKQLDQAGKLKLLAVQGDHLQFTLSWFQKNIVEPYLK